MLKDKWYGRTPKAGMGLVVSNPIRIEGGTLEANGGLDPQELRFSLLFWDRLVWPANNLVHFGDDAESEFLQQCGVLTRPKYHLAGEMSGSAFMAEVQYRAFDELAKKEPGMWSLAQGERSFLNLDAHHFEEGRGAALELLQAIPVPDQDVALEDLLDFKTRRRDELLMLRSELEGMGQRIEVAGDHMGSLQQAIAAIEMSCIDVVRVASERKFPLRLTNTKTSYSVDILKAAGSGLTAILGAGIGMSALASVLTGLGAAVTTGAVSLKVSGDLGLAGNRLRDHPYRYVASFHKELFNR